REGVCLRLVVLRLLWNVGLEFIPVVGLGGDESCDPYFGRSEELQLLGSSDVVVSLLGDEVVVLPVVLRREGLYGFDAGREQVWGDVYFRLVILGLYRVDEPFAE